MSRLVAIGARVTGLALGLALVAAPQANAQLAQLVGWAETADLAPLVGPGEPMFRLPAVVLWQPGIDRDERKYQIEVRLPDGSVRLSPLTPGERPGADSLSVLVPASAVRNLRPEAVRLTATIVDAQGAARVSNPLDATVVDFPAPGVEDQSDDGPFGYGRPLATGRTLTTPEPDRLVFLPLPGGTDSSAYFMARDEISNRQAALRLPGYDPKAGRSDEFLLEDPAQPALGLTPAQATAYLAALTEAVGAGVTFNLPTTELWTLAARGNAETRFWWGDEPGHPTGANFLGPEPGLPNDQTAMVEGPDALDPNPLGFVSTFGNVAEWAAQGESAYQRMGGHFRTEPAEGNDAVAVDGADSLGPDPYVGVRPAFNLEAAAVSRAVADRLRTDPRLAHVVATFDAARATAVLTGPVTDGAARRAADALVRPLWYVAAVENRLETPRVEPGRLARATAVAGPVERRRVLDHFQAVFPVRMLWAGELPVEGSEWWVNLETPGLGWSSYRLPADAVGEPVVPIVVPAGGLRGPASGIAVLSLGTPANGPTDPSAVSDAIVLSSAVPNVFREPTNTLRPKNGTISEVSRWRTPGRDSHDRSRAAAARD